MRMESSSAPSHHWVLVLILLGIAALPRATSFVVVTNSQSPLESIGSTSSSTSSRRNRHHRHADIGTAVSTRSAATSVLLSASTSASSAESSSPAARTSSSYTVQVVEGGEGDSRVVDIATYRNNMVNPQLMVERAQAKRDALDTTKAALDGLKVGLLYVGPVIAIGTYFGGTNDIAEALTNYGTCCLGGALPLCLDPCLASMFR